MAIVSRTVGATVTGHVTVADVHALLNEFPDSAELKFKVVEGDRRDPREAGRSAVVIEATWTERIDV